MRLIDAEKLAEVLNRYLAAPHVQLRNSDISVGLRMGINTCLTFSIMLTPLMLSLLYGVRIASTERKRPIHALSIIFAVTMDARGTMATTFVVTEKGKSNEND